MCGIYGALVVEKGARLNLAVLEELAVINEERGKHAFGFASTNGKFIKSFKKGGKPSELKDRIGKYMMKGATAFVGHTRHATHGSPENNRNNHPHAVWSMRDPKKREGVLVHNGVIRNHEMILEQYNMRLRSECDSEVISQLMSNHQLFKGTGSGKLSTLKRALLTAEALDCPSNFLYMSPRRFAAVRMGRPLWWHKFEGVVYFSSIPLDFESDFARGAVQDDAVRTYNWDRKDRRWRLVGKANITRGKRGKYGAKNAVAETSRDWRKPRKADYRKPARPNSKVDRTLWERVDEIMERRGSNFTPSNSKVPAWRDWEPIKGKGDA